jgi:hypothetical protein
MSKALFFVIPFCSIFILVGGAMVISSGRAMVQGIQARRWPHTVGRVLSVENKDSSDSESSSRQIHVRYAYHVEGQSFEGTVIHPTYKVSSFESAHQELQELLRPDQKVRVYYEGYHPDRSTLSTGFYSCSLAGLAGGLLFAGAGLGFMLIFWFGMAGDTGYARGITVIP